MYETKSAGSTQDEDHIIFEDEYCRLSYDLWGQGGDAGFTIYNKTDAYITLDLAKSFFVVNGEAYDYYLNRRYTVASEATVSAGAAQSIPYYWSTGTVAAGASSSTSSSTSIAEKATRILPPKTHITITQFSVTDFRYTDCDFVAYPDNKKISSVSFEPSESPYQFYNLLNYLIDDSVSVEMKNAFYIEKVSNYPERMFIGYNKKNKCGQDYLNPQPYFQFAGSDKFYVRYEKVR
ncbi:hypothetical protein G3O08_14070 [Cryomorpha ignava]|uniref:Uncharacterized protein n=1 Tax=Cryomorpha ignava TaxID=101383 RepID=A0A7K3WSF7_9FLAO|nr:hypothetical protein [Cryomorpha ignava]NEN24629.1 hypothetical protein [Cryomorpha ignava]